MQTLKKHFPILAVSLFFCLFIYVFYRTEKTLVNQVVIALFSHQSYYNLKNSVTSVLHLQGYFVYSLPEGLWVFCITITSSFFYVKAGKHKWNLIFLPILVALMMELFQLLHFLKGRFDIMDIAFAVCFWLLALFWMRPASGKEPLFQSFDSKTFCCIITYCIVYLAHVMY